MVVLPVFSGAPWHPLLMSTIRRILDFSEIKPDEILCDLGCGDGRVLITAAEEYSARGIGVEIDPIKVGLARLLVKLKNVDNNFNSIVTVYGGGYKFSE